MSSYESGTPIDATDKAYQVGIQATVTVTFAFWTEWLSVVDPIEDEHAHLWDILSILRSARRRFGTESELNLSVIVHPAERSPEEVLLVVLQGSDGDGNPSITVMLPDEHQRLERQMNS